MRRQAAVVSRVLTVKRENGEAHLMQACPGEKSLSWQAQGGRVKWQKSLSQGRNGPSRRDVGRVGAIQAQGGRVKWAEMASSGRRAPAPLRNPGRSGADA